jgi:hypothetical protein
MATLTEPKADVSRHRVIVYTGAIVSHLAVDDHVRMVMAPLFFLVLTFASWALRPTSRCLAGPR